jgi:hypothetical protein
LRGRILPADEGMLDAEIKESAAIEEEIHSEIPAVEPVAEDFITERNTSEAAEIQSFDVEMPIDAALAEETLERSSII